MAELHPAHAAIVGFHRASFANTGVKVWYLNDDNATPRLPRVLESNGRELTWIEHNSPLLFPGCWAVQLVPYFYDDEEPRLALGSHLPAWTLRYLGPLRVELVKRQELEKGDAADPQRVETSQRPGRGLGSGRDGEAPRHRLRASGDMYAERHPWWQPGSGKQLPHVPEYKDIPVFPRANYSFYYTVEDLVAGESDKRESDKLKVRLASFAFDAATLTWGPRVDLTALLGPGKGNRRKGPPRFLVGDVKNDDGTIVGRLELRWVSRHLRAAQVIVEKAPAVRHLPLTNGKGLTVEQAFDEICWQVTIPPPIVSTVTADVWQDQDLHAEMLKLRLKADFDRQWIYHALVVPRIDSSEELYFGRMYPGVGVDTDLVPREGLVVAAAAKFPRDDRHYGSASGKALQDVPAAAFCNFMHELGHDMGLVHRYRGNGFMQELLYFALIAPPEPPFPKNLAFHYDTKDVLRLCHHPDNWVRPGGVPFGTGFSEMPVPDNDVLTDVSAEMRLVVKPIVPVVPLGAPVKLQLKLTNQAQRTLPGPARMSLKDGSVAGRVVAPAGEVRTFSAAAPLDYIHTADLAPGQSLCHAETLWRGPDGALFAAPGYYRIEIDVGWVAPGGIARSRARCKVLISPPLNARHEQAAYEILACPDLLYLLLSRASPGGASAPATERVIMATDLLQRSLRVEELRPILAPIEATLVASIDPGQAARLLDAQSVLTTGEVDYLLALIQSAGKPVGPAPAIRGLLAVLRQRVDQALSGGQIDEAERWRLIGTLQGLERLYGPQEEESC